MTKGDLVSFKLERTWHKGRFSKDLENGYYEIMSYTFLGWFKHKIKENEVKYINTDSN
jgi:hypothetical protein